MLSQARLDERLRGRNAKRTRLAMWTFLLNTAVRDSHLDLGRKKLVVAVGAYQAWRMRYQPANELPQPGLDGFWLRARVASDQRRELSIQIVAVLLLHAVLLSVRGSSSALQTVQLASLVRSARCLPETVMAIT